MSAIAFELPLGIRETCDGLTAFVRAEIFPRHEKHRALLEDPRKLYRDDGRFSDEAVALIREVRRAASSAGFYTMCVPEALGGGGLGHLAYYAGWEHLFRLCGPQNWLMLYVISHWAFGPSRLLERVTDEARKRILEPMNAGEASMCFGLSEPGADRTLRRSARGPFRMETDGKSRGGRSGRPTLRLPTTASCSPSRIPHSHRRARVESPHS